MPDCGCGQAAAGAERHTLYTALALNAAMFFIGGIAGLLAHSSGLLADALDMLADALAYGIALMALTRAARFKRRAAHLNGTILLLLGVGVLVDVVRKALGHEEPASGIMLVVAALSLAVNSYVLHLLSRHRHGEVHLRATWIFTRADVVANLCVIVSALAVAATGWRYPDLVVGAAIGVYVMHEALEIFRSARQPEAAP